MKSLSYIGLGASLASVALADKPLKNPFRGGNGGSSFPRRQEDEAPLVSPEALQALIKIDDLVAGSQTLEDIAYSYPERNRVFGGESHNEAIDWIIEELEKTDYYDVVKQEQVHPWSRSDQTLTVDGVKHEPQTMTYSPSGEVTAQLVLVDNLGCKAADYPEDVAGNIALISRGDCPFGDKSALAGAAEAVGAVIYNNEDGALSGTLGGQTNPLGEYPPTVGISKLEGEALLTKIENTQLEAELMVNTESENRTTYNIIATTKGGDQDNIVALGGHSDSVDAGPGINDDGSGIISNLVIAKALTQFSVKNAVRFAFWTAEEFGLLGSEYYVSNLTPDEAAKIRLYLNFDMIASPNYANMIYDGDGSAFNISGPPGSAQIEALFEDFYADQGLASKPTAFDGRSDYGPFLDVGIPSGGLFTGAEDIKTEEEAELFGGEAGVAYDINYHAAGDNMTNLALDAFGLNCNASAFAVATYALSLEDIPERNTTVAPMEVANRKSFRQQRNADKHRHAGCGHARLDI
ncbi:Leucyl aminopeptidase yscIV [Arachnomyces sp. PD_36]|nr:Leucyl aminopeptidase yscIV [Arachnomyces sp. PD_36]